MGSFTFPYSVDAFIQKRKFLPRGDPARIDPFKIGGRFQTQSVTDKHKLALRPICINGQGGSLNDPLMIEKTCIRPSAHVCTGEAFDSLFSAVCYLERECQSMAARYEGRWQTVRDNDIKSSKLS